MSIKNLFGKSFKSYSSASADLESTSYADNVVAERQTYLPPIDFASAENFVKYGSAKLYYANSIERIYNDFPYDGSKSEKIQFHQSSSYLDRWMFEQKYPKTTGHVTLGTTGYQGSANNGYGGTTTNEYIRVHGGIHTASSGMTGKPLNQTFANSGKYNLELNRTQNWRCNPVSGSTIEFWLKIPAWSAISPRQVLLHLDNGVAAGDPNGGSLVFQINRPTTQATQSVIFDDSAGGWPSGGSSWANGFLTHYRTGQVLGDAIKFCFVTSADATSAGFGNGDLINSSYATVSRRGMTAVIWNNDSYVLAQNWVTAFNGPNGYSSGHDGAHAAITTGGATDPAITITVTETILLGTAGNGGGALAVNTAMAGITPTSGYTGGATAAADSSRFQLSMKDGSQNGPLLQDVSDVITDAAFAEWHHYALTIKNGSSGLDTVFYIDGTESKKNTDLGGGGVVLAELPGLLNGHVGALQTTTPSNHGGLGKGKLSGSLDEFRYWKSSRSSRQIKLNWFRQVGGGMNTDNKVRDLGVYFKFNEGVVGSNATDSSVLDYSGRLANGYWVGYGNTTNARATTSGLELSSHSLTESKDPIIYSTHPDVVVLETEMTTSGSNYDSEYQRSLYHSFPNWILNEDDDGNQNLKKLSQILASYFDTLHAQISALSNLKNKEYVLDTHKPIPFAKELLSGKGFIVKDLFVDSKIYEIYDSTNFDALNFEKNISNIRNLIYLNIYNNLESIYKSKGTEKSIRNLVRCFGIDDEIIKLNMYTDGGTHYFSNKEKDTSVKKKYIDFDNTDHYSATIYQTSSSLNTLSFISGSTGTTNGENNAFTLEADILVPYKRQRGESGYYATPFVSSSIFGFHQAKETYPADYTWAPYPNNVASLSVWLVRDKIDSKDAHFVVKSADNTIHLVSDYFEDIYDNNHWNLALRIKPDTYPYAGNVTNTTPNYTLSFYAANYSFDVLENEVSLSVSMNNASGSAFLSNAKRVYAGAHVTNFTGSILEKSDVQIGAVRSWLDYIDDSAIQQHNKDALNFGNVETYRESNIFTIEDKQIPSQELTIFNWDFDTVTGSDGSGLFIIDDITSGSTDTIYGWIDDVIRRENRAVGSGFGASSTSFIDNQYLYAQRKELPEISYTNSNVYIKGDREINFIKDEDVSDSFYMIEKSMNQVVSEEMLKIFSTIQDFANLIGRPVDSYRPNYKRLDNVRERFFNNVETDLDQEKFINYYKWIDQSISEMILQLVPASVNFGDGVTDVIDSHVLERNKNQRRIGLLDTIQSTEGAASGIEELTYNWKFGHAPVDSYQVAKYLKIGKNNSAAIRVQIFSDVVYSPVFPNSADWAFYCRVKCPTNVSAVRGKVVGRSHSSGPLDTAWVLRLLPADNQIQFYFQSDDGALTKTKRWTASSAGLTATDWHHVAVFYDYSAGHADAAIKIYLDGDEKTLVASEPGGAISGIYNWDGFSLNSNGGIYDYWNVDEFGIIRGSLSEVQANELYNGGAYRNISSYSDLANVFLHYRIGQNGRDDVSNGGTLYPQIGSYNLSVTSTSADGIPEIIPYDPPWGEDIFLGGDDNCLWRHERQGRTGRNAIDRDRETIREVLETQVSRTKGTNLGTIDKTIYRGSTYAIRKLSKPYKVSVEFANSIHGGINYNKQKNREFFKTTIHPHGAKGSSGAPLNVFGIGLGIGSGINPKQKCDDIYDPRKKVYDDATIYVGKFTAGTAGAPLTDLESYVNVLKASTYWPCNIKSGSLTSGYNSYTEAFDTGSSIVNLHSDTTDLTNEIPIQGPFTQAHVGGRQNRHINLNKSSSASGLDNQYTRPEAWRLLAGDSAEGDGAIGFVGPDYGGPYPDKSRQMAIYYREERAKRPVNVRNIRTTDSSAVLGNYDHDYEVMSTFGATEQRHQMRRVLSGSGDGLFGTTYSALPQTTQPQSLFGAGTFLNRKASLTSLMPSSVSQMATHPAYDGATITFLSPFPSVYLRHVITVDRSTAPPSTAIAINLDTISTAADVRTQVRLAIDAAIAAGFIKATRTQAGDNDTYDFDYPGEARIGPIKNEVIQFDIPDLSIFGSGFRQGQIISLPSQLSGAVPQRTIVRTKFSAPGAPETMSEAFLNISSQEFSAYNSINFRNLTVRGSGSGEKGTIRVNSHAQRREGLRTLLSRHCGKFGIDSVYGVVDPRGYDFDIAEPSYHKQHRNTLVTPRITAAGQFRKAIAGAPTTTVHDTGLSGLGGGGIPTTGGASFSFWIRLAANTGGAQHILHGGSGATTSLSLSVSVGSRRIQFLWYTGITDWRRWISDGPSGQLTFGEWTFITVTWDGNYDNLPKFYSNGKEDASTIAGASGTPSGNAIRRQTDSYGLFNSYPAAANTKELDGALTDMAIWSCELSQEDVTELYEFNGVATAHSKLMFLKEYWKLGTEPDLSAIAIGAHIPHGTTIRSEIGETALTAMNFLTASQGPYFEYGTADEKDYDNEFVVSPIPASDFQYAWINEAVSGSKGWMNNQPLRGIAPKSGKMVLVGGGALTREVSVINFPTASMLYGE